MSMINEDLIGELRDVCARVIAKLGGTQGAHSNRYKAAAEEKLGLLGCVSMPQFPDMVRHVLWVHGRTVEGGREPDVFTLYLLRAMQKADAEQLGRLAEAYPAYVALMQLVREGERRISLLMRDAAEQAG